MIDATTYTTEECRSLSRSLSREMLLLIDDKDYTSPELANKVLEGCDLSEWQMGFLALALTELAGHGTKTIRPEDLILELAQMNSQHRHNVAEVVYAITSVAFACTWHMVGEIPAFNLTTRITRFPCGTREQFDALHADSGWGSTAHIRALDEHVAMAFATHCG